LVLLAKQQQQEIINLYTISVCYAWALATSREQYKLFKEEKLDKRFGQDVTIITTQYCCAASLAVI
jgi:hypothetical protein